MNGMKKILGIMVLVVLASGCVFTHPTTVTGPLPKASEIDGLYIGETIVLKDGKPAPEDETREIIAAYKEGLTKYVPEYSSLKVVDKVGPNTLVLKTKIEYSYYFLLGYWTGGRGAITPTLFLNGNQFPITFESVDTGISKIGGPSFHLKRDIL